MNIGHGFKKQEEPRKGFRTDRDNYSKNMLFGESSLSTGGASGLALSIRYILRRIKGKIQEQNTKMWIATLSFIYLIVITIKVVSLIGRMTE
jgi:hypothetical protein